VVLLRDLIEKSKCVRFPENEKSMPMKHPYRTADIIATIDPNASKRWRAIDTFARDREVGDDKMPFVIGYYRWKWTAWLAAWWYVQGHPYADVLIQWRK
jgi:hypothetical protein